MQQARGAVLQPRSRVVLCDSWGNDTEDGPDEFFKPIRKRFQPVQPGYHGYNSPSKVSMNEPVVFWFPSSGGKFKGHQQDRDETGWVVPKLYRKTYLSRRMKNKYQIKKKRAWRKTTNRMQDEIRFRRFPRSESGKITLGQFAKRLDPKFKPKM